jgi:aspartate kinase
LVVYKFGGALARTKRGLEALVRIVREAAKREAARSRRKTKAGVAHGIVLVTSAIGHTTRHLSRAAELAEEGRLREAEDMLDRIITQHEQLATSLGIEDEAELFERFDSISNEIAAWFEGVAIVRELSPRTRDAILASGERLASALIESLLCDRDIPTHAVAATSVIITDEQFGHAHPIIEEIEARAEKFIVPQLRRGKVVLIEGFAGATRDGIVTTMGSESSDLSATLLASVLGAEEVVIWKVLPGLYTADPELVKTPKLIRSLNFEEAEEIGRRGARILFQSFAHPLRDADTLLRIATPFGHAARHTVLQRELPPARRATPLAIALEQRLISITIENNNSTDSTLKQKQRKEKPIETALRDAVLSWSSSNEIHALVRKESWRAVTRNLSSSEISFSEGTPLAAVSLIIRRVEKSNDSAILAAVARSLRGFSVRAILPFERSLIALVDDAEGLSALRKLHHDLFEG